MSNRIHKHLSHDKESRYVRFGFRKKCIYWRDELERLETESSKDKTMELQSFTKIGDTIGFGVVYSGAIEAIEAQAEQAGAIEAIDAQAEQAVMVYCCINGSVVFHKPVMQPVGGFYPAVTLYKKG